MCGRCTAEGYAAILRGDRAYGRARRKGQRASDAATGAALCRAALLGGAVNVTANTRLMKDREYADNLERQSKAMRDTYIRLADRVYADVLNRLQK